jgi:hypothetical protein
MSRCDLDAHLNKIDLLAQEIYKFVPNSKVEANEFRSDLAGMLVVAIAASYEACIKETLINHATRHHVAFGEYAQNNYNKINSRIKINDLNGYAKMFGVGVASKFKLALDRRRLRLSSRLGVNIEKRYELILDWRHDFAHAWVKNTTVEEAMTAHRYAKRVLYSFDEAFSG